MTVVYLFIITYSEGQPVISSILNDTVQIINIKEYLLIYANFTSRSIFGKYPYY